MMMIITVTMKVMIVYIPATVAAEPPVCHVCSFLLCGRAPPYVTVGTCCFCLGCNWNMLHVTLGDHPFGDLLCLASPFNVARLLMSPLGPAAFFLVVNVTCYI